MYRIRDLREDRDLTQKEIAALLAFSDQYHFSNTFKRRKGCSPTEFRSASPVAAEQAF